LKLTGIPYQSDDEPFSVSLSDESFETYELDPPPYTIEVTKKELKQMYYDMVVTRYADPPRKLFDTSSPNQESVRVAGIDGLNPTDRWRWPPTDCTRRRRSEVSATCRQVKRPWPPVSSTLSLRRTMSSPRTVATDML
jgi:hypothetical protein